MKLQNQTSANKSIIFDASTLITFSMNGLLPLLKKLKEIFNGKFLITKEVKEEVVDRPLQSKRYELEALMIKEMIDNKFLEMPHELGIKNEEITKKTYELLESANNCFFENDRKIHLVDKGEMSCLALGNILDSKKIRYVVAVDERTIRLLSEDPNALKDLFQSRLKLKITPHAKNCSYFGGYKFIRSVELLYIAYKKGIIGIKDPKLLDALLYAAKFKGAAVSNQEIEDIKKLG